MIKSLKDKVTKAKLPVQKSTSVKAAKTEKKHPGNYANIPTSIFTKTGTTQSRSDSEILIKTDVMFGSHDQRHAATSQLIEKIAKAKSGGKSFDSAGLLEHYTAIQSAIDPSRKSAILKDIISVCFPNSKMDLTASDNANSQLGGE